MTTDFSLLSPEHIDKVSHLELKVQNLVDGLLAGLHKSPRRGYNVEFREHRPYSAGDDLRNVDWKLFGKSDRYHIKQSDEDANLRSLLMLDASASMNYRGESAPMSKMEYGSLLTACLAYMLIKQGDAAGLVTFDNKALQVVEPRSSRKQLYRILGRLEERRIGGETNLAATLEVFAERIRRRSMLILISDLLDDPAPVFSALRALRGRGGEVVIFHLLDPDEERFPFARASRFVDVETGRSVAADPSAARRVYKAQLEKFRGEYAAFCRRMRIDFVSAVSDEPMDTLLLRFLAMRSRRKRR